MRCIPFLIGDAIYPICTHLEKNRKTHNLANVDKIKYDSNTNFRRAVTKNASMFLQVNVPKTPIWMDDMCQKFINTL
jgi:hypothetical protein